MSKNIDQLRKVLDWLESRDGETTKEGHAYIEIDSGISLIQEGVGKWRILTGWVEPSYDYGDAGGEGGIVNVLVESEDIKELLDLEASIEKAKEEVESLKVKKQELSESVDALQAAKTILANELYKPSPL